MKNQIKFTTIYVIIAIISLILSFIILQYINLSNYFVECGVGPGQILVPIQRCTNAPLQVNVLQDKSCLGESKSSGLIPV